MSILLPSLKISCYRQIRQLELDALSGVNLIVGENNSGKTTFLEALRVLAGRGASALLEELLRAHGEYQPDDLGSIGISSALSNLFYGRSFPLSEGCGIYIGTKDAEDSQVSIFMERVFFREFEEEREQAGEREVVRRRRRVSSSDAGSDLIEGLDVRCLDARFQLSRTHTYFFSEWDRSVSTRLFRRFRRGEEPLPLIPVSFVPFRMPDIQSLADTWDDVVLTDGEELVLECLRFIEPKTRGLAFVQGRTENGRAYERQPVIKLDGVAQPVSLRSMGDGMMRVLQLALSALRAKDGLLLIDELENGLHYTVQERVWELLFRVAEKNNIQIFATTHSLDCVKTFSRVAGGHARQEGTLIKMNRDDADDIAVSSIRGEELADLVLADIEVR